MTRGKGLTPLNLASIRKQNHQVETKAVAENDDIQSQAPQTLATPVSELSATPSNAEPIVNNAPPWPVENESQATPEALPVSPPIVSPFSAEKTIEEAETFDSSAHLDEENVGDVTLEISAFLPDKQSEFLQFAQGNLDFLDTAQQQLKDALCLALNESIELEIVLGQPINTPYALQLKVNQVRNEYAREVVKNDPGIQLLQQQFAAKIDQQSIQAR